MNDSEFLADGSRIAGIGQGISDYSNTAPGALDVLITFKDKCLYDNVYTIISSSGQAQHPASNDMMD